MNKEKKQIVVVLDNIRSTHNVGSIFRTADALGVGQMILCGTTPTPTDRFGRARKDIAKVALGAEESISWKYEEDTIKVLKDLKKVGYLIVAIEQAENSMDYKKVKLDKNGKVAFIMGEEVEGEKPKILKLVDVIAEIPMLGQKESLNVSVAFGVAVFRILSI